MRLAKLILPARQARMRGACPELVLGPDGRLQPAALNTYTDASQDERHTTAFGDFVVNDALRFRSRHCLETPTDVARGIDSMAHAPNTPRDAYVLGAGSAPLMHGPHSAFLFLLSRKYRTVFVNDIQDLTLSSESVNELHAKFCRGTQPSNAEMLSVCTSVPTPPDNLDFRFMRRPASDIPVPFHADIFVMFPNPPFLQGAGPIASLRDTLLHLLSGEGNVAYTISELDYLPMWGKELAYELGYMDPTGSVHLGQDSSGSDMIFPHAAFWTLSGRQIDVVSVHFKHNPPSTLYALELNTWHASAK